MAAGAAAAWLDIWAPALRRRRSRGLGSMPLPTRRHPQASTVLRSRRVSWRHRRADTFHAAGLDECAGDFGAAAFLSPSASTSATILLACSWTSATISRVFCPILYAPRTIDLSIGLTAPPSFGR